MAARTSIYNPDRTLVCTSPTFGGSALPSPFGTNSNGTGVLTTSYSGPVTTVTDQAGATRVLTADALGRLIQVTEDPNTLNYLTGYTYYAQGDLTQVSQGASSPQTRWFSYDTLGRLTTAINPESGTINYAYNDLGLVTQKTDARGAVIKYAYDGLGRVYQKTYSGISAPQANFCYDGLDPFGLNCPQSGTLVAGRLREVWTSSSITDYPTYDELGRVLAHTQTTNGQAYPFQYTYNLADGLTGLTYPSERVVSTGYDSSGRANSLVNGLLTSPISTYASNIAYAPQNAPNGMNLGNGKFEEICFNNRLQPFGIRVGTASTNGACTDSGDLLNIGLSYATTANPTTNNGNLLSQTIASPGLSSAVTQYYTYDGVNRLGLATENPSSSNNLVCPDSGSAWCRQFGYDAFGNMWTSATTSIPPASFAPVSFSSINAANNQLTNVCYDAAGNLTAYGLPCSGSGFTPSFVYDAENRMVTANLTTYTYDGDGRRVAKTVGGATTTYVYDAAGQLAAEYENTTPPTPPCTTCYLTADHLGSTRMMTDASGSIQSLHDYLPFGEEIPSGASRGSLYTDGLSSVNDTVAQKFTAKERDGETGLDYFGARYYSGAQGRFTSADPLWVTADRMIDPQRLNLYAYGRNNPLKYSDPTGTDVVLGNCASNMTISMCQAAVTSGLSKEDRSHTRWVKGDGTNGFKKGQWGLQVDSDYKSSSKNFANLQTAANSHDGTAAVNIVAPHTEIPTMVGTMQNGRATAVPFQQYMASQGVNAAFNYVSGADEAFGQTLFPLIGQPTADTLYAPGRDTQMYLAADDPGAELTKTFFHELVHIVLGDFGRTVPKSGHDVPGVTKLTNAAEAEAQKNYGH